MLKTTIFGAFVLCSSFAFWLGLFRLSYHLLDSYFQRKKWQMSHHHIMNMCEAIVSGAQAIASSVCGVVVVLSCYHDVMWAVHPLASDYGLAASSYFIYDTVAMYEVYLSSLPEVPETFIKRVKGFVKKRTLLVLHHVGVSAFLFPVLVYRSGIGDFFVGCFFCVELSGPFTNMRVILSRLGLKYSRWYLLNGIAMILSFALCRVVVFPYMYLAYGAQYGLSILEVVKKIPLHCNLGCLLVLIPQLHWLRLMILGAIKMFSGKKLSEAEEKID
ncbi:TLC domain-containing protein 3A-like [Penaeus monodon]|uniref:TLC domain-containing protein 3A-like n=1 Tax=Penaeus monodon TaxID=6687 RepID=UPI0018A70C43|nr:TLC domain-containing protein 3A-like [Penaeus monodon]XP_037773117.1 TLC domain-containing protein 3A-like [Penaeus monodon]XP_037773122.1 TLC domain-containing protein 3A-like [Penaeus monodon]XP_037773123.1 TLC domain-containing protein 3A-like [Penaeus monodon]XP_037773124.1 TLC domain-containing protein 3A-like [Penaeus monodon]XP_037773125.1 TLC domain-containing protein 3A-like [Penaeus monodon]